MKRILVYLLIVLSVFLFNCSGKTDKEIYESATANITKENYAEALSQFKVIVSDYPNSEYYKDALLQTGELYQGLVDKEISEDQSLKNAINAYKLFNSKYPDDPKAAQTLFMVAFIQANELNEIDSARVTYTKYIELYPESVMAESAKSELENLGLTPDEILAQKLQENQ